MTTRRRPAAQYKKVRGGAMAVLLSATMALGGCALLPETGGAAEPGPESPASPESRVAAPAKDNPAEPEKPLAPVTAVEEFSKKLTGSLTALAAATKAPNREQMRAAMLKAGAVQETIEVSVDITPTGLAVDAIEAASPIAKECVIGQVRDGKVAVTVLPVLASGRCFVGDVH